MLEEQRNIKENIEELADQNPGQAEIEATRRQVEQQREQIVILHESTKQNLIKRQSMKQELYENYQMIKQIRGSIDTRIQN